MIIARVIGSAVSTIKVDSLHGSKLLIVQRASTSDELEGDPFVAVDAIGAGEDFAVDVTLIGSLILHGYSVAESAYTSQGHFRLFGKCRGGRGRDKA